MKINFFVTIRAHGAVRAVSSVIRSQSKATLEQKLQKYSDIEVISIVPVCQINEMCK
jgi:hypothetical protein